METKICTLNNTCEDFDKTQELLLKDLKTQMCENTFIVNGLYFINDIEGYNKAISDELFEMDDYIYGNKDLLNNEISNSEKFANAVYLTYRKYGYELTEAAIKEFIKNGKACGFTRDFSSRRTIEKMSVQEVKNIIIGECNFLNYDLYLNKILQRKALDIKSKILKNACIGTLLRYNKAQVSLALDEAKKGNFKFFSNCGNLNLREILIRNVNREEVEMLMKNILIKCGIDNDNDIQKEFLDNLESITCI